MARIPSIALFGGLLLVAVLAGAGIGFINRDVGPGAGRAPEPQAAVPPKEVPAREVVTRTPATPPPVEVSDPDRAAWEAALARNTLEAFRQYVGSHPAGKFRREADARVEALADEADWIAASKSGRALDLRTYLEQHPNGLHAAEARTRLTSRGPAAMPAVIKKLENRELEGDAYVVIGEATFEECAARCAGEERCKAIELYREKRSCGLFDGLPPQAPKPAIDVGIKLAASKAGLVATVPAKTKLKVLKRRSSPGEGFDTTFDSDYASCEARCLASERCQMIELYKPEAKCNLFDHKRTEANAEDDTIVAVR